MKQLVIIKLEQGCLRCYCAICGAKIAAVASRLEEGYGEGVFHPKTGGCVADGKAFECDGKVVALFEIKKEGVSPEERIALLDAAKIQIQKASERFEGGR